MTAIPPDSRRPTHRSPHRLAAEFALALLGVAAVQAAFGFAAALLPLLLLAFAFWRLTLRATEALSAFEQQQEHLEHQAVELEEQAAELEQQVEELGHANAALVAAQAVAELAHRETLREAAERIRHASMTDAAMTSVPIALSLIDHDLRYIKVNDACAVITGRPVDQHPGQSLRELNPLLDKGLEAAMRHVLATGEPCLNYRLSRPTPHAKGGILEIVLHITPFYDVDGAIAGICSTATDLTEWRVLQEQFFQAQKLEAVGQLAAGIAHDFNNLLTVIATYCDLVLMEIPAGSPYRDEIEEIRSAAARATTLARRMLGAARHQVVIAKPVDLTAVVLEARDLLHHAMRDRVYLTVQCAEGPGVIVADPTQIEQVLLNLVINAVDAMPTGGEVSVRTRPTVLDHARVTRTGEIPVGSYMELTVADTGTGMDEATLARIFEPFFTTKPQGKGTGLGLATVFGIVRDLGGGVEVESILQHGTTFRVLLPRAMSEEATGPRRARREADAALPRGSETLLLVEDEDALRTSIARLFTRQGYRVLEARHGGEALRIAADEDHIDLVVSDLNMPGVSGRELSERMHALGRHMPVLFMSGSNDAGDETDAPVSTAADGRNRFINKPFEVEALLTTVRGMLEPA